MKLVMLIDSLGFGGAQRQMVNLALELKKRGHEIVFCTYAKDDFYLPLLEQGQMEPCYIENRNYLQRILRVRHKIRRENPDVLISFLPTPNFLACLSSVGAHRWKVITSERVAREEAMYPLKNRIFHWFRRYSDSIVCNSRCAEELWKRFYPRWSERITTIYNIVDVPKPDTEFEESEICRILVAARYEQVKNLDGLVEAVHLLSPDERSRLRIDWYGKANHQMGAEVLKAGQEKIREYGLEDILILHDATDRIHNHMICADYVGLFSHNEGLPNAILEGMMLSKPIIMTRTSDYRYLVDRENGFLCDSHSPDSMAAALREAMAASAEQRRRFGEVSHHRVQKLCAADAVVSQWQNLL